MNVCVCHPGYVKATDKLPRATEKPHIGLPVQGNQVIVKHLLNNLCVLSSGLFHTTTLALYFDLFFSFILLYFLGCLSLHHKIENIVLVAW